MLNSKLAHIAQASGTVDAITASYAPIPATLSDGLHVGFRSTGANTATAPTFNADGTGAKTITKNGGLPLLPGDIGPAGFVALLSFDLANDRWELTNPGYGAQTSSSFDYTDTFLFMGG